MLILAIDLGKAKSLACWYQADDASWSCCGKISAARWARLAIRAPIAVSSTAGTASGSASHPMSAARLLAERGIPVAASTPGSVRA